MIILKAKFIGKTSLGFISGDEYDLLIDSKVFPTLCVENYFYLGKEKLNCEYSNVDKFLDNWDVISIGKIDSTSKFTKFTLFNSYRSGGKLTTLPSSASQEKLDFFYQITNKIRNCMRDNKLSKILSV